MTSPASRPSRQIVPPPIAVTAVCSGVIVLLIGMAGFIVDTGFGRAASSTMVIAGAVMVLATWYVWRLQERAGPDLEGVPQDADTVPTSARSVLGLSPGQALFTVAVGLSQGGFSWFATESLAWAAGAALYVTVVGWPVFAFFLRLMRPVDTDTD